MFSAHPLQPTVDAPPLKHSPQRSCSGMDKDGSAWGCPMAVQIPWDQRDTVLTGLGWGVSCSPAVSTSVCLVAPQPCSPCEAQSGRCPWAAPLPLVSRLWGHSTRCLHGTGVPTAPASLERLGEGFWVLTRHRFLRPALLFQLRFGFRWQHRSKQGNEELSGSKGRCGAAQGRAAQDQGCFVSPSAVRGLPAPPRASRRRRRAAIGGVLLPPYGERAASTGTAPPRRDTPGVPCPGR